jgi:hypothetical protein
MKNGLRAVLFCLKMCAARFYRQICSGNVKNAAAVGDNRSRLTKVMPL